MARPAEPPGRPLLDRLGVKPEMRVAIAGLNDPEFEALLAGRGARLLAPGAGGLDLAFLYAADPADLAALADLRSAIKPSGAIWVLRRKGAGRTLREVDLIDAGARFDMVDNKIASFSDSLAAMRLVIPLALR